MTADPDPDPLDTAPFDVERHVDETAPAARVYDTVETLTEPAPVEAIADLAMCEPEDAEPVLDLLADLRIVRVETDADTKQYVRNDSFFRWWRATTLAAEYGPEELTELQTELRHQRDALREVYDADTVENVSIATKNDALRAHIREDIERWRMLEETCEDIELSLALYDVDPAIAEE